MPHNWLDAIQYTYSLSHCHYRSGGGLSQFIDFIRFSLYRELAELHKANATKDSEAQELALSREVHAKEELSLALEKVQEESRLQQEALANQVILFCWFCQNAYFYVIIILLLLLVYIFTGFNFSVLKAAFKCLFKYFDHFILGLLIQLYMLYFGVN